MDTLQLSENLYPVDEVIATFTQCILMRSSIHECLYWLWELLYTCANINKILLDIYYQFYGLSHKSVGRYITRKLHTYHTTHDKRHVADIVCNLRLLSPSPTAYYITHSVLSCSSTSVIYKHKSWMQSFPSCMKGLLGSIHSKNIPNIGYYLRSVVTTEGFQHTYAMLSQYGIQQQIDLDTGLDVCEISYHTLCCLISRCIDVVEPVKSHFICSNKTIVATMENHFVKKSFKYYRKLQERRLYSTHSFMPPGIYGRFKVEGGLEEASNMHWEYYCFNSLEWNKKFIHYGGNIDHLKRSIQWTNDELLEQFYDNDNCMDFDEQTILVKDMSLHPVEVILDPHEWYKRVICESLAYGISKIST